MKVGCLRFLEVVSNNQYPIAVMAEWLRRWTRNPLGFPRAGSNPTGSVQFL